ncbi:MAG: carboxypeptidase-like regulatory domain-containing protein [Lentimicrobiaceae bacterium]|nr:carboxypeptidase-like regulatory domain-containing protein [Lentimicrobiaceae bacterium]
MTHGRKVCNTLKEIRRQIADKNDIEYSTDDCRFEGECKGTCPKCDAEVKYLEKELHKRTQLGKTAVIAGISLGIAGTFSAYNTPQRDILQNDNLLNSEDTIVRKAQVQIIKKGEVDAAVKGKVFDEDGKTPLEYTVVRLMQDDRLVSGTLTDKKGEYAITPVPAGKYNLVIVYAGLSEYILENIEIKDSTINIIEDVTMEASDLTPVIIGGVSTFDYDFFDPSNIGRKKMILRNGEFVPVW